MNIKSVSATLLLMTALVVSACGGASAPASLSESQTPAKEVMADKASDEAMMDDKSDEAMMSEQEGGDHSIADKSGEAIMADEASHEMMTEQKSDEAMMEDEGDATMMDEKSDEAMMSEQEGGDHSIADESDEAMMADEASHEMMTEQESDEAMLVDKEADDNAMMDDKGAEAMAVPDWFNAELINVNTGETFKIADFKGKVVLVETMAVWCSTCLKQQNNVRALHQTLGERDDLVSVALDIDPNEDAQFLQAHTSRNGFDWVYAVATPGVAREIGQLYGAQFLNPPSAPMFIIDRHGEVHVLPFGVKDAQTLQETLAPILNES